MFDFVGLIASGYAGWKTAQVTNEAVGWVVFVVGAFVTLALPVGAFIAVGAAVWIHKKSGQAVMQQYDEAIDIDEAIESMDRDSYLESDIADYGSDDESNDTDSPLEATYGEPSTTPRAAAGESGGSGGASSDGSEQDPYSVEW